MEQKVLKYHHRLDRRGLMGNLMNNGSKLIAEGKSELFWLRAKSAILNGIGWYLEKTEAPAKVKEFEFINPETNEIIYLSTGRRYSVLHVGNKRFFFDRVTGVFDGTSTSLQDCVVTGSELSD
jgi:hypothetical protein